MENYFLNIKLDGKIKRKFILKHLIYSLLWIFAISILFFRLDLIILRHIGIDLPWLEGTLPIILLFLVAFLIIFQKWYFTLAFFLYPLLSLGWFLPKVILKKGKIYLLGNYLNNIFNYFKKFKRNIIKTLVLTLTVLLLFVIEESWSKWLAIIVLSYSYFQYVLSFIKSSFKPASIFGASIEEVFHSLNSKEFKNSFVLKSFIKQQTDKKLKKKQRKEKQVGRLIILSHILDYTKDQINGFRGKRAIVIALIFSLVYFIFISISYFWFVNYQLYLIDSLNFNHTGNSSVFEFLFYTLKSVFTFSHTELIIPISILAKIVHILSFIILGIFLLVLTTSFIFSLRNDKIKENIELTNKVCKEQKEVVLKYMESEYKTDLNTAMSDISTIHESLKRLKNTMERLF